MSTTPVHPPLLWVSGIMEEAFVNDCETATIDNANPRKDR
jgi:hypothetical protein